MVGEARAYHMSFQAYLVEFLLIVLPGLGGVVGYKNNLLSYSNKAIMNYYRKTWERETQNVGSKEHVGFE